MFEGLNIMPDYRREQFFSEINFDSFRLANHMNLNSAPLIILLYYHCLRIHVSDITYMELDHQFFIYQNEPF